MKHKKDWKKIWLSRIETRDDALLIIKEAVKAFYGIGIIFIVIAIAVFYINTVSPMGIKPEEIILDGMLWILLAVLLNTTRSRMIALLCVLFSLAGAVITIHNSITNTPGGTNIYLAIVVAWISVRVLLAIHHMWQASPFSNERKIFNRKMLTSSVVLIALSLLVEYISGEIGNLLGVYNDPSIADPYISVGMMMSWWFLIIGVIMLITSAIVSLRGKGQWEVIVESSEKEKREAKQAKYITVGAVAVIVVILGVFFVQGIIEGVNEANQKKSLFEAIDNKNIDGVKKAISAGVDINFRNNLQQTPLMGAVHLETMPIVQYLVENGAEVNAQAEQGITPLMIAVASGNRNIVLYLLQNGADIHIVNDRGGNALTVAMNKRDEQMAMLLKANGAVLPNNAVPKKETHVIFCPSCYEEIPVTSKRCLKCGVDIKNE